MLKGKYQGFTLIEVVVVIIVLSIVAALGSRFIVSAVESYRQTQERSKLINRSRQTLERMSRQLRGALPFSLRTSNGGNCLEFIPIAGGANYLSAVPDQANGAAAAGNTVPIATSPYTIEFETARYAAIGALATNELYGAVPVSLSRLSSNLALGTAATSVTLNNNFSWQRNSIQNRIYLLNAPWAFCLETTDLRVYQDFNTGFPLNTNVNPDGSGVLMAQNVAADGTLFVIANGTEERNAKVTINMAFSEGGEQVTFSQEVTLRNVP